ncbi:MAG: hypothetical protein QXH62_06345, partial [Candidatus Bathyarchaeia archaeon]
MEERTGTESLLTKMMEEALDAFHRRLVVLTSKNVNEVLSFLILKHKALRTLRGLEDEVVVFVDYYDEGGELYN